jgi:hypothetical protein
MYIIYFFNVYIYYKWWLCIYGFFFLNFLNCIFFKMQVGTF